jgi:Tfp pilus assembly PilM family ATPase
VDVKRIPEIVRYEAKQQIPFPLEEVIWDFEKMAGGAEVEGFAIDAEVGLVIAGMAALLAQTIFVAGLLVEARLDQ